MNFMAAATVLTMCGVVHAAQAADPGPEAPPPTAILAAIPIDAATLHNDGAVSLMGSIPMATRQALALSEALDVTQLAAAQALHYFTTQAVRDANNLLLQNLTNVQFTQGVVTQHTQTLQGVPIEGTYATASIASDLLHYARHLLVIPPNISTQAHVGADQAMAQALAYMVSRGTGAAARSAPVLTIAYFNQAPTLAWRVDTTLQSPQGAWNVYVDAQDGNVLGRKQTSQEQLTGRVTAMVDATCGGGARVTTALPYVQWAAGSFADAAGTFATAAAPTDSEVTLNSPYITLQDMLAVSTGPFSITLMPAQANPSAVLVQADPIQLDAYVNYHSVRDWLAAHGTINKLQRNWANTHVPVNINLPDHCNAYFDAIAATLNFFSAGGGCSNTAQIPPVVHHEYGHGIQYNSGNARNFTTAVAEGLADVTAIYSLNSDGLPGIGPTCSGSLRTCANTYTYCEGGACTFSTATEGHTSGQVLCGAWRDVRAGMQARYGEPLGRALASELYLAHLPLLIGDLPDTYLAAIAADADDDHNPANGTRHSCEINNAFFGPGRTRRFPNLKGVVPSSPSLAIQHTPPGQVAASAPLQLSALLTPQAVCGPAQVITDVRVHYAVSPGNVDKTAPMLAVGNGADPNSVLYTATLSDVMAPATVTYYITATLDGAPFTYPYQGNGAQDSNAPNYRQTVRYASETTLTVADFENDNGGLIATSDAADGRSDWEWDTLTEVGGDLFAAQSGSHAWGTRLRASAIDDVSTGRISTLTLPAFDARSLGVVTLQYWRFMYNPGLVKVQVNGQDVAQLGAATFLWRDTDWMHQSLDISAQAAGKAQVVVRFVVQDAPSNTLKVGGFYVDTLSITGSGVQALSVDSGPSTVIAVAPLAIPDTSTSCAQATPGAWASLIALSLTLRRRRRAHRA